MECHFLKSHLSRNYQFLSRRWTYVRSEVDDVYSIPRPRCPLVAPDTSSICQLQAPPRWGTSCSFTSQSRRENIGPQFRTPSERSLNLWPRRCAGHTRCRCSWLRVQQWSQQTTHSLLAASWSQQTTHCWPPVDHDERRIVGLSLSTYSILKWNKL